MTSTSHTVRGPTQVLGAQIYVCGGHQGACCHRSVERYTPGAPRWEEMPPMRAERSGPGVAAVGGLLYAVGGSTARGYLTSVERLDPRTGRWAAVASLGEVRACLGAVEIQGVLYAVGGRSMLKAQPWARCARTS